MKRICIVSPLSKVFLLTCLFYVIPHINYGKMTGRQIVSNYLQTQNSETELAFISMNTYASLEAASNRKNHRFLTLSNRNQDGSGSFIIRMIRPQEVNGVTVLSKTKSNSTVEQFIYLPEIGKINQIKGKGKSAKFLGTDFTFEDLQKEIPGNFSYERLDSNVIRGIKCYRVRATRISDSIESYYSHREMFIGMKSYNLHKINFYRKDNTLSKTLESYNYDSPKVKGETTRPRSMVMTDLEKNTKTEFIVIESRLNLKLDAALFTQKNILSWTEDEIRQLIFDIGFTFIEEQ